MVHSLNFNEQSIDKFTIIFIGKVYREKGRRTNFEELLAICQNSPRQTFVLYGAIYLLACALKGRG